MGRKTVSAMALTTLLVGMLLAGFGLGREMMGEARLSGLGWKTDESETQSVPPATQWNRTFGGTGADYAEALVQTSDGGYAVAGSTGSFGLNYQAYLVKTDATGNKLWSKTYGGTGQDDAFAVVQTEDGGYALAGRWSYSTGSESLWLIRTDSSGTMQWNKTYGTYGAARALVQTSDGGYALAGDRGYNFLLVKIDASGNMQWNKTYGGTSDERAYALVQTGDGGYALAGYSNSPSTAGGYDFWLVKTDSSGTMQWNKTYGGTKGDFAYALVQTGEGGYALAGYTLSFGAGDYDFWLVKADVSGNMQWSKAYGGTASDGAFALVQTKDNGYALTGWTSSSGAGLLDFLLVKTDSSGTMRWNKTYGGTKDDYGKALVQTWDHGYAITGYSVSFGAGGYNFWLIKLAPEIPVADGCGFPLDEPWTISQRFGRYSNEWGDFHLGEDVLRSFEAPVYAPADGIVVHNAKRTGYGYVVIIEHELMDGTFLCSVLAHLRKAGRVQGGSTVTKGQVIGYLSSLPDENGGVLHLHYGIRKGTYSEELDFDGKWRYRGYGPIDIIGLWYSPSTFIGNYNANQNTPEDYSLTVNVNGDGTPIPAPGTYILSANTKLSLVPSCGEFQQWQGTDNDNLDQCTVTMNTNKVVTALYYSLSTASFTWPASSPTGNQRGIIQDYGIYGQVSSGKYHTGIDIETPDSQVFACAQGVVEHIFRVSGGPPIRPFQETEQRWRVENHNMQNVVVLRHILQDNSIVYSLYAHLGIVADGLTEGQVVQAGDPIGTTGVWCWRIPSDPSSYFWLPSGHFEIKNEACLENPDPYPPESQEPHWGYTPYHPDYYGYRDPILFLHRTRRINSFFVEINFDGVNVRCGPTTDYYRSPAQVNRGQKFLTVRTCTENAEIWYQILDPTDGWIAPGVPEGWVRADLVKKMPIILLSCPADLTIVDPDGFTITKGGGEVSGMSYIEYDIDLDGELDDVVTMSYVKNGNYFVAVSPESGANQTSTYALEMSDNSTSLLLVDNAKIGEISTNPYVITQNETTIMLRNINTAVTNVTTSKKVLGQGYSSSINVTVQNQGSLAEALDVTLYANTTIIGTLSNINLASGSSVTIPFTWDTSGVAYGNYIIDAHLTALEGETYTVDNAYTGGIVVVTIPGDVNADGIVDIVDLSGISAHWYPGPPTGPLGYDVNCDVNDDEEVNILDLSIISAYWTGPPKGPLAP